MMTYLSETVSIIKEVDIIDETDKSFKIYYKDRTLWVPKSVIHNDVALGFNDEILISDWFAEDRLLKR